ncbi:MAG: hypothetical protein AAF467_27800 [Actinomycetota bacterium]
MTRRTRLLIAVTGVALEVFLVLVTHPTDAPPWRNAISIAFAAVGLFTFAVVAAAAVRDNANHTHLVTGSRPAHDPFATDWSTHQ